LGIGLSGNDFSEESYGFFIITFLINIFASFILAGLNVGLIFKRPV